MEQHFPKFPNQTKTSRGIPKFSKMPFPGSFLSIQLCSQNFQNFRLNGSHAFRKSTVSRISENFSGNFCTIAAVSKFSKVLVEWKAPRPCKMVTCFVCLTPVRPLLSSMAVLYHVNDYPWRAYSEPSKPGVLKKWSGFNTNSEFKLVKSERFYPES